MVDLPSSQLDKLPCPDSLVRELRVLTFRADLLRKLLRVSRRLHEVGPAILNDIARSDREESRTK